MKVLLKLAAITVFTLFAAAAMAEDNSATVELYKTKCAKCHGADGTATAGGKKLGAKDAYDPEVMKQTDAEWIAATSKGKNKMPAFGKSLNDDQLKELVG